MIVLTFHISDFNIIFNNFFRYYESNYVHQLMSIKEKKKILIMAYLLNFSLRKNNLAKNK